MDENLTLGLMIEKTTRIIKLKFHHLFKSHNLNLTPEQWAIMDILHNRGTLSQKEIVDISFKDAPSVSRLLEGLIKKDYISKVSGEEDRRVTSVSLTLNGKSIVEKLRPEVIKLRRQGIDNVSSESLDDFVHVLKQIFNNYKN